MEKVALIQCNSYEKETMEKALQKILNELGGLETFLQPNQKVFLKLNLVTKKNPSLGVTTHPALVEALIKKIQALGAIPILGDSPGGYFTPTALKAVYRTCGIEEIAQRTNALLNYNTKEITLPHPTGKLLKNITVAQAIVEADSVISLPKLKTHGMTLFTGAVKNLFGIIPGLLKAEYHFNMPRLEEFSQMLVDICTFLPPQLSIMDAVIGMEGEGPTAGQPRKIGALIASTSPFALDVVACSLINLSPLKVCTIQRAKERNLHSGLLEDIELLGDALPDMKITDFLLPTTAKNINFFQHWHLPDKIERILTKLLTAYPYFDYQLCQSCALCAKHCPAQIIEMKENKPVIDLQKCIRCFCCQELCPYQAVQIKRPFCNKLFLGKK